MAGKMLFASLSLMVVLAGTAVAPLAQAPTITPLDVKPGYWQNRVTVTMQGGLGLPPEVAARMTPQQRAMAEAAMGAAGKGASREITSKSCLTRADLTTDPLKALNRSEGHMQCSGTVVTSTASDLVIHETCTGEGAMDMQVKIHALNSEHAVGDGDGTVTADGHSMKSQYHMDMTWLGPTCPANSAPGAH